MFKKGLSLMLAAILSVGIAGCGSSTASSLSADTEVDEAVTTESDATEATSEVISTDDTAENTDLVEIPDDAEWKIGMMGRPLSTGEEFYRTAEDLINQYGEEHFVFDVYPENPQNEQEVTISKALNIAADPDVKVMIFDLADVGTIAAVNKVKEERPDMEILFGSLNEDVYEMAKVSDLQITLDPEGYGESLAQFAADAGAEYYVFYSFARHMSNSMKVRYRDAMKETCEKNGVKFVEITMPDPMGDSGITGAQQFIIESVESTMKEYDTDNIAYFASVSTVQDVLIKTIVENHGIYPCHTDPSPFQGYAAALGLEIPEEHKFDGTYVTKLISDKLAECNMTGRCGGWENSMIRCDMEFLFDYAIEYCEGKLDLVNKRPDADQVKKMMQKYYGNSVVVKNATDDDGNEYDNWFIYPRDLYSF